MNLFARSLLTLTLSLVACAPGDDSEQSVGAVDSYTGTITFGADYTQRVTGAITAGKPVRIVYDANRLTQCRGETNGQPAWAIGGYYRVNGGNPVSFGVAPTSAQTPAPVIVNLPNTPGTVEFWFENGNRWGCHAWDSNWGHNYTFPVAADPRSPGWIGNGMFVIARETCNGVACDRDRHPITERWTYETWARQRAAIRTLSFEVWKEGVTDRDNPDLWRQLDVRMYYRFGSTGAFQMRYVAFETRTGNNARYAVPLTAIDPLPDFPALTACPPVPLAPTPDGTLVSTLLEYYFTVNGVEYRPANGTVFSGVFSNYKTALLATCLPR